MPRPSKQSCGTPPLAKPSPNKPPCARPLPSKQLRSKPQCGKRSPSRQLRSRLRLGKRLPSRHPGSSYCEDQQTNGTYKAFTGPRGNLGALFVSPCFTIPESSHFRRQQTCETPAAAVNSRQSDHSWLKRATRIVYAQACYVRVGRKQALELGSLGKSWVYFRRLRGKGSYLGISLVQRTFYH